MKLEAFSQTEFKAYRPFNARSLAISFGIAAGIGSGKPPRTRPLSIRLTDQERKALKLAAGTKSVGQFARERLLGSTEPRKVSRQPKPDAALLGKALALLGRSELHASVAGLGTAAKAGAIEMTPELVAQLQTACADIQEVKRLLLRGLGLARERRR